MFVFQVQQDGSELLVLTQIWEKKREKHGRGKTSAPFKNEPAALLQIKQQNKDNEFGEIIIILSDATRLSY